MSGMIVKYTMSDETVKANLRENSVLKWLLFIAVSFLCKLENKHFCNFSFVHFILKKC
jgi:hypothetical protein